MSSSRKNETDESLIRVSVLSSHGATVARTAYWHRQDEPLTATGEAKREPGDEYDAETGRLLAASRALEILAGKLRRKANGRIRNADAIKRHRDQARKRKPGVSFKTVGPVHIAQVPEQGKARS